MSPNTPILPYRRNHGKKDKVAAVELKFRNVDYNTYPTIWLEKSKQTALMNCTRVWTSAYFMPVFNGKIYRIEVRQTLRFRTITGGRTDRGIDDIDQMVDVPMNALQYVGEI